MIFMDLLESCLMGWFGEMRNTTFICCSSKKEYCVDIANAMVATCLREKDFVPNSTFTQTKRRLYDLCVVAEKSVIRKMKQKGIKIQHEVFSTLSKKICPRMSLADMGELCRIDKVPKKGGNWEFNEIYPLIENRYSRNAIKHKMEIGLMIVYSRLGILNPGLG